MIDELSADATMDELEADIQRRLNLIKESLAKLDAPLSETSTKKGKALNMVQLFNMKTRICII